MKLEVEERGKKEYYDEFLYVISMHKKIRDNPSKKVQRMTIYLKKYLCYVFFCLILFLLFYLKTKTLIYIFFIGILFILLFYTLIYLYNCNKAISTFQNYKGKKIIEINDKGIEYKDEIKSIKIFWDNMEFVLFNKYSICFIPKEDNNIFISVSIDYINQVLEEIKKYKKENLIRNNAKMYAEQQKNV